MVLCDDKCVCYDHKPNDLVYPVQYMVFISPTQCTLVHRVVLL